ncbi:MAG: DUF4349 domain-containing protein [Candidatus Vogelbacteria bacterium]|nr:DUF4349 domain-containing protein [Candidatus Vogelbacteria bacterium]
MKENIAVSFLKKNKTVITNTFAAIGVGGIVLLVASYLFGVVKTNNTLNYGMGFGGGAVPTMVGAPSYRASAVQDESFSARSTTPNVSDRKIIKNGSLSLLVESAEDAAKSITKIAESAGGFVENATLSDSNDCVWGRYSESCVPEAVKSGNITIRVPANTFESSFDSIKKLAIKINSENNNSRDVSAEFVDQQAKLKNLKAEEAQYQDIMKRAVKVEDVLNVARQLSDVRGRIDVLQGQINYLSRQVGMSTISVDLRSEASVASVGNEWRPVSIAKQALQDMLTSLTKYVDATIIFIINIPVLILQILAWVIYFIAWLLGFYLVWRVLKYLKGRFVD